VDTLNAALGVGFPAMRAVELAEAGVPLAQVIAEVEALVQRTHTYFVLDSLTYLERGGRIGKAAAIAASILKIKPVLTYIDGVTDVMDRPRTKKVALERLWAIIDKHMQKGVEYVGFHYGANRTEVEGFQREFTSRYNVPSILTQLGPVVGTYSGPDMIGIVIAEKKSQ
jgi:DegV family protein with EDD domain